MMNTDEACCDPELLLLGTDPLDANPTDTTHAARTAPIVTADALHVLGPSVFPQRALYGRIIAQRATGFATQPASPKLYINTNAPFSALVCGVQGSGKSHSTSVLLESCLMSNPSLGTLPAPLSAIVFHFDTAAGGGLVQPCEAAYLAALDESLGTDATPPAVTVLVLPKNLQSMCRVYAGLPSVKVEPLHFSPEDISGERLLAMMKVDENTQMPLYMEAIMSILRSMENDFDYAQFRHKLSMQKFNPGQKAMLNLRLSLLDSCLQGGSPQNRVSSHFKPGQLTIIDLSSPFMDGASACSFFDLVLGLFVEASVDVTGKLVVLDEAHKYLSETQIGTSARLTDSLLTVIRQQRHLATRVVISTQEPTVVPPKYLDLCSFVIAHRFSSPKWLKLLAEHVSAAEDSFDELFEKIVSLGTGQAILFAPNGLGLRSTNGPSIGSSGIARNAQIPATIGQGYLHVQSRLRITRDGGHSILAVPDGSGTRLGRVSARSPADAARPNLDGIEPSSAIYQGAVTSAPNHATIHRNNVFNLHESAPAFVPSSTTSSMSVPSTSPSYMRPAVPPPITHQPGASHSSSRTAPPSLPPNVMPPVPSSEGAIEAIVNFLRERKNQKGSLKYSFHRICTELLKTFPALSEIRQREDVIWLAERQGRVVIIPKQMGFWVMLRSSLSQDDPPVLVQPDALNLGTPEHQAPQATLNTPPGSSSGVNVAGVAATTRSLNGSGTGQNTLRVITCSNPWLLPLMRHVLSVQDVPAEGLSVQSIKNHFERTQHGLYGGDNGKLKQYKRVVSEAITAGMLISTKGQPGTGKLTRFALVPGAQYIL